MKIKLILLIFLLPFSFAFADDLSIAEREALDLLIDQAAAELGESFRDIPSSKTADYSDRPVDGIAMLPIKGDIEDKFYNRFREQLTKSRFFIYEKREINKLLENAGFQMNDIYSKEGRLEIGKLTQWKGLIFGSMSYHKENFLGKKKIYLEVNLTFENIERGLLIWTQTRTFSHKFQPSWYWSVIITLGLIIVIMLVNWLAKGRNVNLVVIPGFLVVAMYLVWFFFI